MSVRNLLDLSDEVLLQIFKHLTYHEDVISLSETCSRLNRLMKDRRLCENVQFGWNINIERRKLVGFILNPGRINLISKLSFNDLYWLPSGVIRNILLKLPQLKEFYGAGTQLSWTHFHQFLKATSESFTHVGWTWDSSMETNENRAAHINNVICQMKEIQMQFSRLKALVLHIPGFGSGNISGTRMTSHSTVSYMISLCNGLEELWILSWPSIWQERKNVSYTSETFERGMSFPNVNSFILNIQEPYKISVPQLVATLIKSLPAIGTNDRKPLRKLSLDHALADVQFRRGMDLRSVESLSIPLFDGMTAAQDWNLVKCKSLHFTHVPAETVDLNGIFNSATELEKFCSKSSNYSLSWDLFVKTHLKLQEVNVSQDGALPYPEYCIALASLPNLKKVSVPDNSLIEIVDRKVLEQLQKHKNVENIESPNYTRCESGSTFSTTSRKRRIAHTQERKGKRVCGLDFLTSTCSEINELELGFSKPGSESRRSDLVLETLVTISRFTKLKKLTLDKIPITDGSFLVEIAKSCKLESLRLSNLGPGGKCIYMKVMCNALQLMEDLKDFRLEQNYLGCCGTLFKALAHCKMLQRIAILCPSNDRALSGPPLEALMETCPRLSVLFIILDNTTKIYCHELRLKLIDRYKHARPPLSIIIRNNLDSEESLSFPSIHQRQLVVLSPHVCTHLEFPNIS